MDLFNKKKVYLIRKSPYGFCKVKNSFGRQIIKEYDEEKDMPYETGKYLETLFQNNEDYVMGIHKTGYSHMTPEMVLTVFGEGIKNLGDIMQGIISHTNRNIEKTIELTYDFMTLIGQIKTANRYKTSTGVFVVKIPKSYLGEKDGEIKPIYFESKGTMYLLPEFICGYIPISEDAVGGFVPNSNYTDFHNYKNDGLRYDIRTGRDPEDKPENIVYFHP